MGKIEKAFDCLDKCNLLKKENSNFSMNEQENIFNKIKNFFFDMDNKNLEFNDKIKSIPIFIVGMPRSGTTLVEQIISSHSQVTGAGELGFVRRFGAGIATGTTEVNNQSLLDFRHNYLNKLRNVSNENLIITDKMPQNFRYIALLCAAFPEAKIVHVQRNAEATCWSNFKHYFASKGLGYSYDLADTVRYYGLYKELMHFWSQSYSDRIYLMDYDKLTEDQEPETRRLVDYLELNWEEACLAPQNNKRAVKTVSQQEVRQEVYKGSSQAWRKYAPFLDGVFDELET